MEFIGIWEVVVSHRIVHVKGDGRYASNPVNEKKNEKISHRDKWQNKETKT